jgi:hypothetical protein
MDPKQTVLALWVMANGYVSLELAECPPIANQLDVERERSYMRVIQAMLRGLEATATVAATATPGT